MTKGRPSSKDYSNGIQRPREGSEAHKVWELCAGFEKTPKRSEIIAAALAIGIAVGTATHQYSAWIRYHGFTARGDK